MPDMGGMQRVASVEVFAPARLHLGFLDLAGSLGRRFGGIGLAIDGFGTRLTLTRAAAPSAEGPGAARALEHLAHAAAALGLPPQARIVLGASSPEHAGLGSGTQLGLAVAAGLARLHQRSPGAAELAAAVGRGARSGVGIAVFEQGGFIVDGGRGAESGVAPVIARLPFPADWRLLLLLDPARHGLHGKAELAAFGALPPFSESLAGTLCHHVLLQLLPGLAEQDFAAVSAALGTIQARLGDYFSAAQGGRYTSPAVGEAIVWLERQGVHGVGQSSWGPTGFALFDSAARAEVALAALIEHCPAARGLQCRVVAGLNRGAEIGVDPMSSEGKP